MHNSNKGTETKSGVPPEKAKPNPTTSQNKPLMALLHEQGRPHGRGRVALAADALLVRRSYGEGMYTREVAGLRVPHLNRILDALKDQESAPAFESRGTSRSEPPRADAIIGPRSVLARPRPDRFGGL
jgi:hypothetical protein